MTGFLSGLGVLTDLSQVGDLTAYSSEASNKVARTIDTFVHWWEIDFISLAVGALTIALILVINRNHFDKYSLAPQTSPDRDHQ
jgi:SulP family sulfate permease